MPPAPPAPEVAVLLPAPIHLAWRRRNSWSLNPSTMRNPAGCWPSLLKPEPEARVLWSDTSDRAFEENDRVAEHAKHRWSWSCHGDKIQKSLAAVSETLISHPGAACAAAACPADPVSSGVGSVVHPIACPASTAPHSPSESSERLAHDQIQLELASHCTRIRCGGRDARQAAQGGRHGAGKAEQSG